MLNLICLILILAPLTRLADVELKLITYKRIAVVAFGNLLGNFCVGMMEVLIPLYLIAQFNLTQMYQGLVFGAMSFSYLFATQISGMSSDRYAKCTRPASRMKRATLSATSRSRPLTGTIEANNSL